MSTDEYVFAKHRDDSKAHLAGLSDILDRHTTAILDRVGVKASWRCVEVGPGNGSIATWLADRVAPDGEVTAIDVTPQEIPARDNLTLLVRDIREHPLEPDGFDLIHARLVLMHLPERAEMLRRLARALRPGGALVVSDWDATDTDLAMYSPDPAWREAFDSYIRAFVRLAGGLGLDVGWARRSYGEARAAGLVDVDCMLDQQVWPGGTGWPMLHHNNTIQIEGPLRDAGVSQQALELTRTALRHPDFALRCCPMFTTVGRRRR